MQGSRSALEDLAPLFHFNRLIFMLSFSKLDASRGLISSPKNLIVLICVRLLHLGIFVFHFFAGFSDFIRDLYDATKQTAEIATFALFQVLSSVDTVNVGTILIFSVYANTYLNVYLRHLGKADKIVHVKPERFKYVFHLFAVIIYLVMKMIYSFAVLDVGQRMVRVGPRVAFVLNLVSEQSLLVLCIQLRKRFRELKRLLQNSGAAVSCTNVRNWRVAFDALTSAQNILISKMGSYLLFNLSQLFMMSLCSLLFAVLSCSDPTTLSVPMEDGCRGNLILFLEVSVRFYLVVWACNCSTSAVSWRI
jgi:hypothetical protein